MANEVRRLYPIPWFVALLVTVPETFLVVKLGFKLFGTDIDTKKALSISLLNGIFSYFVRRMPLIFGLHTIAIIISLTLLVKASLKYSTGHCFASVAAGSLILGVLQSTVLYFLLLITSRTVDDLARKPWLNILYFIPIAIIMILLYRWASKNNFLLYHSKKQYGD